jgi:hypothetical protein
MSQGLGDKPWCNGNHFTLADIAVGVCAGLPGLPLPRTSTGAATTPTWPAGEKLAARFRHFIDTAPPAQQVGQQAHLVVGTRRTMWCAVIWRGCLRPAACTSSFSASSVFWWKR